jgi:hypothetical protein
MRPRGLPRGAVTHGLALSCACGKIFTRITDHELIKQILDLIVSGSFTLSFHAKQRMNERQVTQDESRRLQGLRIMKRFRTAQDEANLEVVAAYEAGVVIVSVF